MEAKDFKRYVAAEIRTRLAELQALGVKTTRGERISMAAIGRTLDPPVHRVSLYNVRDGDRETQRIRDAIERELRRPFWIRRDAA